MLRLTSTGAVSSIKEGQIFQVKWYREGVAAHVVIWPALTLGRHFKSMGAERLRNTLLSGMVLECRKEKLSNWIVHTVFTPKLACIYATY